MILPKLMPSVMAAAACFLLANCASDGRVDLRNPTQAELDAADIQWGLQPRKSKGPGKRTFQYPVDSTGAPAGGAEVVAQPAPPPVEQSAPAPQQPPTPQLDPGIDVNKLR